MQLLPRVPSFAVVRKGTICGIVVAALFIGSAAGADDAGASSGQTSSTSAASNDARVEARTSRLKLSADLALYEQWASDTLSRSQALGTFAWQLNGRFRLLDHSRWGTGTLGWSLLGSQNLGRGTSNRTMSNRVGSISGLNANTVPDGAAVDEFYWRHASADGRWILLAGRIDQSDYFDANRAANDGFGQFLAFAFENNLSIPWSTYGSFGGLLRVQLKKRRYLLASIGAAGNEDPRIPWSAEGQDGWNQVIEFGAAYDLAGLGRGHIRVTPWHSRVPGASGFGLALNLDQALGTPRWGAGPTGPGRSASGPMVGFFRAGVGEPAVTPVQTFVSAGAVLQQPFGRARDALGLGFAWSKPSPGAGQRSEGLIETYYRFALSPAVSLTPDLQIVINPAQDSDATTVAVLGLRLHLKL